MDEQSGARTPGAAPKRGLLPYFQFSLRGYVGVMLLAGAAGCVTFAATRIGFELVRDELRSDSSRYAAYSMSNKVYGAAVHHWHMSHCAGGIVHCDALDVVMRRADVISGENVSADLARISKARKEGDRLLAFEVDDKNSTKIQFAYLIRNDYVVYSAIREPGDKRWVEQSSPIMSTYIAEAQSWVQGISILLTMLLLLFMAGSYVVCRGLYRLLTSRPAPVREEPARRSPSAEIDRVNLA